MNFGEKLTSLRKQKGLSQEELAEKLNVTRQTISKWELEQTSPDTAKLTEIAEFFNVGVNELTNKEEIKYNNYSSDKKEKKTSAGVIVLIILLVLVLVGIIYYVAQLVIFKSIFNVGKTITDKAEKTFSGIMDGDSNNSIILDLQNKYNEAVKSSDEEFERNTFNNSLKYMQGTQSKFMLSNYLDKIVTNNKTNENHIITVIYKETNTDEEEKIVEIKHSLNEKNKYEVSLDYDEDGYIYKVTISEI